MDTKRFDKWVLGAGGLIGLLVASVVLNVHNTRRLNEDAGRVAHTHRVVSGLENVLSLAKDAETGQRGYVITGDPRYLGPYTAAVAAIDRQVADVGRLTADNPRQQARLPELRQLVSDRMKQLELTVALRKDKGFDAAAAEVLNDQGKAKMDALRAVVGDMQRHEGDLLRERSSESEQSYRTALLTGIVSGLAAVAGVVAFMVLLRRHVAARTRAAREVAEQAERLRTTLASIGDAVITTDVEGRVTNLNAVAESLTGWATADAVGQPLDAVFNIVNETTRKTVESPATRALREGVVVGLANHTVLIGKGGTERPIDDSAAPIRCKAGEVVGCVLVFRDITERKQADANEREASEQVSRTLESVSDGFFALDRGWRFTYVNRAAGRLVGIAPADLIGQDFWASFPGVAGSVFEPVHRRAMAEATAQAVVSYYPDHDRWYEVNSYPTPDGIAIFFRDVTAHKRAERLLKESEERRRLALDSADLGTWHVEPGTMALSTDERFRLLFSGEARPLDYERAVAFIHPDDRGRVVAAVGAAVRPADPAPYAEEYRVVRADGSVRWVLAKGRGNFRGQGQERRVVSFDGTVQDITDRKQAEVELRRRETFISGVLGSITDAFYALAKDWRFTFANDEIVRRFGRRRDEIVGSHIWEMFPAAVGNEAYVQLHRAMADRVAVEYEVFYDPWGRWFLEKVYPTGDGGLAVYTRDITDDKRAEALQAGQKRVLEMVATGRPLPDVLAATCRVIEEQEPGVFCSVLLPDEQRRVIARAVGPSLPDAFQRRIEGLGIGPPYIGSCGEVLACGGAVVVPDVGADERFAPEWRGLLTGHGFMACRSTPVLGPDGTVLASFAIYRREPGDPAPANTELIATAAHLCSIAIGRQQADEKVRASEERFRSLIELSPQFVWVADGEGRITFHNQWWYDYTGQVPEQALGWGWAETVHPDHRDRLAALWVETVAAGGEWNAELPFRRADGEYRWHLGRARPVRGEDGKVVRWYGLGIDIHDQKRQEEEREAIRRTVFTLIERCPFGIYVVDADFRIASVNAGSQDKAFANVRPLIGRPFDEAMRTLWPEPLATELLGIFRHTLATGGPYRSADFVNPRADTGVTEGYEFELHRITMPDGRPGVVCYYFDATKLRDAERLVRVAEERFRTMADNAPVLVWQFGENGTNYVNRTYLDYFGQPADELVGMGWATHLHPDDADLTPYLTAFERRGRFDATCRFRRHDGEYRWFYSVGSPQFGPDGTFAGFIGFSFDVTDSKRAGERLRASEERLRLIVESATDYAIFTLDIEGVIDGWNSGAERLFGYAEAEVVGQHERLLYTPEDAAEKIPEREMKKAGAEGRAVNERWHVRKDGSRFWGSGLVQPLRAEGRVVGFLKIMRDMTEARLADERLREAESRFRTLADNSPVLIWQTDGGGVTFVNRQYLDYFGQPVGAVAGMGWAKLLHPNDATGYTTAYLSAFTQHKRYEYTCRFRRHDGEYRWLQNIGTPQFGGPGGSFVGFIGCSLDVTDSKLAAEALVEADRKKDEFLATLAHELRNPLAPLRNGLQIMKLAGGDAAAVEKSRSMMERQVGQMSHLIDDLMDLSRISRGKIALQKMRLKLAEAVQDAVDTARPLIEERGHELVVDVPPEPLYVDADRTRLSQILGNLLNNAAKYTDRGGRIRVAVERQGSDVVVAVEDNGVGIPAHLLTTVFDMFAQVDRSLEKSQGGLGIGLNIVKRLVEMHDGSIVAESDGHGAGSRFVVRLPVVLTVTTERPDDHNGVPKVKPARRRILVVDDNVDGADSLAEMLRIMGNETQTAHDGLEAVDVAAAFRPDVILMDIGMPRLNGYEACRRIRGEPWGRNVIIVAQTGWGQEDDKRKSQDAGFNFHMVKPVDPAALEKMLAGLKATTG